MDPKSLAKSKRSHAQHHTKKSRPNLQKPIPNPSNKPVLNQNSIPSNWDRYEEQVIAPEVSNVILQKSKGNDYAFLLSEARDQTHTHDYSFASVDDLLPDFQQGARSLLFSRGQCFLSWIGNDNFIVNDRVATTLQAPFLSLNLHVLADQLSKVDLSQRLFIESDLLLPELNIELFGANSSQENEYAKTGQIKEPHSEGCLKTNPSENPCLLIEASSAEIELDMLLASFNETKITNSSPIRHETLASPKQISKLACDTSLSGSVAFNFDSIIDDLLEETSGLKKASAELDSCSSVSTESNVKSKVLDDFDSWLDTI